MAYVIAIFALVVIAAFAAAIASRRRTEFRADLLDLVAGACRRSAPVSPIIDAAAWSSHRKRHEKRLLQQMSGRLDAGAPLSDAFAMLGRRIAPPHVVSAIRAAEGTSRLPAVLEAVAADTGETLRLRHRLRLASLYPVLLTVLVLGLHLLCLRVVSADWNWGSEFSLFPADAWPAWIALGLVLTAATGVVGLVVLDRLGRLPGTRRLATARLLSTSALLLEAGLPVTEAFRRAAKSSGHRGVEHAVSRAAASVEEGEDPQVLWDVLGLPAADRVRLAAAGSRLAAVLTQTAGRCLERWKHKSEMWIRWLKPATVLVVGALVFVDFRVVMGFLQGVLVETHRSVSLW